MHENLPVETRSDLLHRQDVSLGISVGVVNHRLVVGVRWIWMNLNLDASWNADCFPWVGYLDSCAGVVEVLHFERPMGWVSRYDEVCFRLGVNWGERELAERPFGDLNR